MTRRVQHGAVRGGVAAGRIFWSYANKDGVARAVLAELQRAGVPLWWDRHDLQAGELYDGVIEEAVRSSVGMVLFVHERPTDYQLLELRHARRYAKVPLVVHRAAAPALEDRHTPGTQLAPWHDRSTLSDSIRDSGLGQWIERTVAGHGDPLELVDGILELTRNALGDHTPARSVATAWFPDGSPSRTIASATAGIEAADPTYREDYADLVTRCRRGGLGEPSMLRAFAMARRA